MNYIKLINAFYDQLETIPLSTSAIALWHALVHINNKAAWQSEFTVAVSVLCVKTSLSDRTVTNARNELKQKGYINFKSRKGNRSAVYSINDLSVTVQENLTEVISYKDSESKPLKEINADSLSVNVSDSLSCNLSTLNKQNKTKQNNNYDDVGETKNLEEKENAFRFFQENFKIGLNSFMAESIASWVDDFGDEIVIEAMKRTLLQNSKSFKYTERILQNWLNRNVKSMNDIKVLDSEFENRQQRKFKNNKVIRFQKNEPLPEWIIAKEESVNPAEWEKQRKLLEERIAKL